MKERNKANMSEGDLRVLWEFLDPEGLGKVSVVDLKKRLSVFYPSITTKEAKFLMQNKSEMTRDDISMFFKDGFGASFDHTHEAFKLFTGASDSFIDLDVLKTIFVGMSFGELTEDDVKVLFEFADKDGDGEIGLEDFREVIDNGQQIE